MNLIYIGDKFDRESKSMMSPIYTEAGQRSNWGFVQIALERGEEINIRPATLSEMSKYEAKLKELKEML